jgi:hypothetical protein
MFGLHAPVAHSELAPFAGALNVVPSTPKVGNCMPFANNVDFGFSGFIYRNIPAFTLRPGTVIAFDLAGINDRDVRREIYFSAADHNPGPGKGNVRALGWTKVVSDTQVPSTPRGNSTVGDYELRYRAESDFTFGGGGFIIGFAASPPSTFADLGCEQVGVHTSGGDASGNFFARFWNKPHLDTSTLDRFTFGTTFISGFVLFVDVTPPVVSADISPAPGPDGWVDAGGDSATVTWTATDDESGVAWCDEPVHLTDPGIYQLTGRCADRAGNIGSTTITVRLLRHVRIDLMPGSPVNPLNANRRGPMTFLVLAGPGFDPASLDRSSLRFGVTGNEPSVRSCQARGSDLLCRFDVATSGVAAQMLLTGYADGIRVVGVDNARVVGKP